MQPLLLNDIQRALLGLFSREMTAQEQDEIRELLLNYYDRMLQNEVQQVIKEKGYTAQDFERVLNQSQRTK
ncbi:MAG: hypothetical protein MUE30_18400 [Spirosomaceae bacterium]|jgi:hypothetical protein|nr:hypothetical protein [Spirosomataceae bacterium]